MRFCLLFLIVGLLQPVMAQNWNGKVYYAGALRKTMQEGFTGVAAQLDSVSGGEDLFGLGAVDGLKGEFIVMAGEITRSYVANGSIRTDPSYAGGVTLLVYTTVREWKAVPLTDSIETLDDLESFVERSASGMGIDTTKPFPFLLEGRFESVNWHIIDWPENDPVHTHEKHKSSGLNGALNNEAARMLGFYSKHHKGIFTHHTRFIHIHGLPESLKAAVHVDDLEADGRVILFLPAQ
ncbi:acetolactate decarboxylase [Fulvivirga sedimenti]|uniref:Acetolactate decarboxylase n=1 Tax=Fulvivirga sedimenti TaxID=2879465 RepID=A0A9X1HZ25_9BACT|nr:acetolactate decarboxylase [Fulvivirga sedimenti]MCA6079079.1 acetolactate decarboxylase [Fulvivirga sedimenti]